MATSLSNLSKDGHRKRTKNRYLKTALRTFADYEILEMVLYNAIARADTKPLAKKLLSKYHNLLALINAPTSELKKIEGVGDGVILQLKLFKDFSSRLLIPIEGEFNVLSNWNAVINYCQLNLAYQAVEYFRALFLNSKNILIGDELCQIGTINRVEVYPREVAKKALEFGASAVILVHNHPSGDPQPSKEDKELTQKIIKILQPLDIVVHDHILIAGHRHFSFRGGGLIT